MPPRPFRRAAALTFLLVVGVLALASSPTPLAGSHAVPALTMKVAPAASSGLTASPNPDDVGISSTFDASSVCHVALLSCSFAYTGLPSGCSSSNSATLACTPSVSGQFTVKVTAMWGCPVCMTSNSTLSFTVHSDPVVASMTANPATADVGQLVVLQVSVTGGSPNFAFAWSGLPAGCGSLNANSVSCRPNASGTSSVGVSVRDAAGGQASGSVALTVNARLLATLAVSPPIRDLGGSVLLSTNASGGQAPYAFTYTNLPAGCASSNVASLPCTPTALGTYAVTVSVNDAVGGSANATSQLQVVPGPGVSLSVSPATVDIGETASFQATVTAGAAPFTFTYTNLPRGCATANTSSLLCAPTAPGTYSVAVSATDSEGGAATASAAFVVDPALTASISANVSKGSTPLPVAFTSLVSGGTAPFVYAWRFAPNAASNATDPRYVFVSGGNFSVSLTVRDATGASVTASFLVAVHGSSNEALYTISFFVNPAGCGPITLNSVLQHDGSTAALPSASFAALAPTCPGFAFTQWVPNGGIRVNDTAARSTTVEVTSAGSLTAVLAVVATHGHGPSTSSPFRSVSSWAPFLPLIVGGGAALFLVKGYFDRRGKIRHPSRSDDPGEPFSPGEPRGGGPSSPSTSASRGSLGTWVNPPSGALREPRTPSGAANRPAPSSASGPSETAPGISARGGRSGNGPPVRRATDPAVPDSSGPPWGNPPPPELRASLGRHGLTPGSTSTFLSAPAPRTSLPPRAPEGSSSVGRSDPSDLGPDRRSWPPSGIWEMTPTPNSPRKGRSDHRPGDGT
ncbi:MAG TPA: hypothetical protein VGV64_06150 [Thermoplasmata archaeon]|nr:hypothetical protein [Thermoplasmata archaeon]